MNFVIVIAAIIITLAISCFAKYLHLSFFITTTDIKIMAFINLIIEKVVKFIIIVVVAINYFYFKFTFLKMFI